MKKYDQVSMKLSWRKYILEAENGITPLLFNYPTLPEKVAPKNLRTLGFFGVFGGAIGVIFVLIKNSINRRKIINL